MHKTKDEMLEGAKVYFEGQPNLTDLYATSDGHYFTGAGSKGLAYSHTNRTNMETYHITRDEVMGENASEDGGGEKKTAKKTSGKKTESKPEDGGGE